MVYKASKDISMVGLLVFHGLWPGMYPWVVAQDRGEARDILWVVARNDFPWVMARDSRWTRGTFELWLRLASVAGVSVLVMASTDGSRWIALLSDMLTSLVVLGRYRLCS